MWIFINQSLVITESILSAKAQPHESLTRTYHRTSASRSDSQMKNQARSMPSEGGGSQPSRGRSWHPLVGMDALMFYSARALGHHFGILCARTRPWRVQGVRTRGQQHAFAHDRLEITLGCSKGPAEQESYPELEMKEGQGRQGRSRRGECA